MKSLKLYIITGIALCNLQTFGMKRSQTRQNLQLGFTSLPQKPLRVYVPIGQTPTTTLENAIIKKDLRAVSVLLTTESYTQERLTKARDIASTVHLESHNQNGSIIGCPDDKACSLQRIKEILEKAVNQKDLLKNQKKLLENAIRTNDIDMMRINLTTSTYRQDTLADALALANELHTTAHMDRKGRITGCATNAPCNLAQIKNLLKSYIKN